MRLPFVALTFFLCTMCAELPDIDRNVCGNGAVEKGEQCDGVGVDGVPCYSSGVAQCHLDCSGTDHKCPAGFRCGADDVCRQPSGSFASASIDVGGDAQRIATGDLDGDRRADLVSIGSATTSIRFFTESGAASGSPVLVSSGAGGTNLGVLSDDGNGSLVLTDSTIIPSLSPGGSVELNGGQVTVLRGTSARTLLPSIYPNLAITSPDVKFIGALSAGRRRLFAAARFTINATTTDSLFVSDTEDANATTIMFTMPQVASKYRSVATIPQVGFACESVVFVTDTSATVYPTCKKMLSGSVIPNTFTTGKDTTPQLPEAVVTFVDPARPVKVGARPISADLNADGRPDLIVPGYGVAYVAFGVSDGSFHSTTPVPPSKGDGKAYATALFAGSTPPASFGSPQAPVGPLAVGFLDGDGLLDWVTSGAFFLSSLGEFSNGRRVTDALIGDFNGNGKLDMMTLSTAGFTFFNGNGLGAFNIADVPLDGTPVDFAVGDFDGDFVKDVAIVVRGSSDLGDADAVYSLFGRAGGFPEAPQRNGVLTGTSSFTAFQGQAFQARDVLAAVSAGTTAEKLVTLLVGDANRQFSTPFNLRFEPSPLKYVDGFPLQVVSGRFGGTRGIVALAIDTPKSVGGFVLVSPNDKLTGRLWFVPANGSAQLEPSKQVVSQGTVGEVALTLRELRATGAAVLPSSDGQDLVVVVIPGDRGASSKGKLVTAKIAAGAWSVDGTKEIGAFSKPTDDLSRLGYGARFAVGDFDGDGVADAVVQALDKSGAAVLFFLKNRNGVLDAPVDLTVPPDLVAITSARTEKTNRASLVMITRTPTGNKSSMWLGGIDNSGGPKKPVEALALSGAPVVDAAGADINGDGVDDLLVSHGSSVEVHLGVAEVP